MNICFLANAKSIHTQRWVDYFATEGWCVHLITWRIPDEHWEIHPNIIIHKVVFPPHYLFRYCCLVEIIFLMRKIHPDIIHAHYLGHFGIIAGIYSYLLNFRPLVLTVWGSDILQDVKGLKKLFIKFALERADLVTCDGENSRDAICNLDINPEKIKIIYHGVDTNLFNKYRKNKNLIKDLFGQDDVPVVISARSLNQRGNLETLIKAIPLVLKQNPNVRFIIAGDGPQKKHLEKMVISLSVKDSIKFVGHVLHDKLPEYLASSDVYVSTSLLDGGIAVATLDAMASEVAVITTNVADNGKWIVDGKNGFVVPVKSPEIVSEKILYLLEHPEVRKTFGQRSRDLILEKQEYRMNMDKMNIYYKRFIKFNNILK